jgi:hypothetical protein
MKVFPPARIQVIFSSVVLFVRQDHVGVTNMKVFPPARIQVIFSSVVHILCRQNHVGVTNMKVFPPSQDSGNIQQCSTLCQTGSCRGHQYEGLSMHSSLALVHVLSRQVHYTNKKANKLKYPKNQVFSGLSLPSDFSRLLLLLCLLLFFFRIFLSYIFPQGAFLSLISFSSLIVISYRKCRP